MCRWEKEESYQETKDGGPAAGGGEEESRPEEGGIPDGQL